MKIKIKIFRKLLTFIGYYGKIIMRQKCFKFITIKVINYILYVV